MGLLEAAGGSAGRRRDGADIASAKASRWARRCPRGGPYFGFMCCKQALVRQMPGRIVGRTVDLDGKPGFTLTLQAREQHIRRSKATSNICTNQGLAVTAATIYMALLGAGRAAQRRAAQCSRNTLALVTDAWRQFPACARVCRPVFHEVRRCKLPESSRTVSSACAAQRILGGIQLGRDYPELGECTARVRHRNQDARRTSSITRIAWPTCCTARKKWRLIRHECRTSRSYNGRTHRRTAAEPLIFELSATEIAALRAACADVERLRRHPATIPAQVEAPLLPEVSELDAVRHYTRLSQKNFSIDTHFYPLGSCTMKYNPRACNSAGDAAAIPRAPSARARSHRARDSWPACTSCRKC